MKNSLSLFQKSVILLIIVAIPLMRTGVADFLFGDDTAYFRDALFCPLGSIVKPYAGYVQILCRTAASLCLRLPDDWAVSMFMIAPIISLGITAAIILNLKWLDPSFRAILALSTVILPHSSEVYSHLCNCNWTASLLTCVFLFQPSLGGLREKRTVFTSFITALLGLSSIYVALLSPLYGLRFLKLKRKTSGEVVLLSVIVITSAIQTLTVISSGLTMSSTNDAAPAFAPIFSPLVTFINAIFILPVASYVTSVELLQKAVHNIRLFIPTALLICAMCLSILYLWWTSEKQAKKQALMFFGIGYYLIIACAARTANALQLYIPMRGADRYFFLPYVFFTIALSFIVAIRNGSRTRRLISYLVVMVLAAFYISEWTITRAPEASREIWFKQLDKLHRTGSWDFNPRNGVYMPTSTAEDTPNTDAQSARPGDI